MKRTALLIALIINLVLVVSCTQDPPHVHDFVLKPELRKNPTCISEGSDTYICSCGETKTVVLPRTNTHLPSDGVSENEVAPSCTVAGNYDYVVYCSLCHTELSRESRTGGDALSHDLVHHDAKAAGCTEEGWGEYYTCSRCDYTTKETIPALGHSFTQEIASEEHLKSEATCMEPALYYKSCAVCGEKGTETFSYGEAIGRHNDVNGYCSYCGRKNSVISYGIEVPPIKTTYLFGTAFESTGMVLKFTKDNGDDVYVSSGYSFSETVDLGTGTQNFPIHYLLDDTEYILYQTINVTPLTPVSLTILTPPERTTYFIYEKFDASGLSFALEYDNPACNKTLTDGFVVEEPLHDTSGEYTVFFRYTENDRTVSCGIQITVLDVVPEALQILTPPTKTEYIYHDVFDPTGIVLRVVNNDGSTNKIVATGFGYPSTPIEEIGDSVEIPISYSINDTVLNASQVVKVVARTPVTLSVSNSPTKVEYVHGEVFDSSGLKLLVGYDNGTEKIISEGFSVSMEGSFMTELGETPVSVSYSENGATVCCIPIVIVSHQFNENMIKEKVNKELSDYSHTVFYLSCCCGEASSDTFDHVHVFYDDNICQECSFNKNVEALIIEDGIVTGLDVPSSELRGNLTLPEGLTGIASKVFYGCLNLTRITIPGSVTSIGSEAFSGCTGLTSLTIPDSVTSIGSYAFYGCTGLTSITIPDSFTSIGEYAFLYCNNLKDVYVASLSSWLGIVFGNTSSNPMSYADNLYINGELQTRLVIPDGVTSIGDYAFYNCTGLTSVLISDSVSNIGSFSFTDCSNLTNIAIPNSVTFIGSNAFRGCSSLKNVYIESLSSWLGIIFKNTYSTPLCYEGTLYVNGETLQTSLVIPDGVTSIGDYVFSDFSKLTNISIPDSVTSIGYSAFYGCEGLKSITIPDSVTSIGGWAFAACRGLTSITIPDSVTSIDRYTFYNCKKLTNIAIPDSVTSIGYHAFWGCSGLTSITIPDSVTSIGSDVFDGCSNLSEVRCCAESKPSGWESNWLGNSHPTVIWGWTPE